MTNSASSSNGSSGTQIRLLPDEIDERLGRLQAIPYYPAIARHLASPDAALLLRQIWFLWKNNGHKPFQKFVQPCDHPMFETYGAWITELDWSKYRFYEARGVLTKEGLISVERNFNSLYWSINENKFLAMLDTVLIENPSFTKDMHVVKTILHSISRKVNLSVEELLKIKNENGVSLADILPEQSTSTVLTDTEKALKLLKAWGVSGTNLSKYAQKPLNYIISWILLVEQQTGLNNPAGWMIKQMRDGEGVAPFMMAGVAQYLTISQQTLQDMSSEYYNISHYDVDDGAQHLVDVFEGMPYELAHLWFQHRKVLARVQQVLYHD